MKRLLLLPALLAALGPAPSVAADAPGRQQRVSDETQAVIVVTGMRLGPDAAPDAVDRSAAEGAVVRVRPARGEGGQKVVSPFRAEGQRAAQGHLTADFLVDLDTTYEITMTFRDGTVIRIDDYRLPREWRTHFYFHNTRGTLSPASVLRIGRAPGSDLACYIYAVFPLENYRRLGGVQLEAAP